MDRKIKITYFINDMSIGGAETLVWNVVNAIDHSRFACTVAYMFGKNEFPKHEQTKYVRLDVEPYQIYRNPKHFRVIWNYFSNNRCDILHTHLCYADTYGQIIGTLQNTPVIYSTIHNIVEWPRERRSVRTFIEDHFLQRITRVIAVGEALKNEIVAQRRCPPERVTTLYNGIDFGPFVQARKTRSETRAALGIEPDAPLVLCTAQFRKEKRHDLLLAAFERMLKQAPNAKLLLVGNSGEVKDRVVAWIAERKLGDTIIIRSGDRDTVARYCGAADIFTMHSEHEGLSIALNEAMAAGLPAVVPKLPVFMECVTDAVDGYVFPFGDIDEHANALTALWKNVQEKNIFWQGTAFRVQRQFSIQEHIRNLSDMYIEDIQFKSGKRTNGAREI